MLPLLAILLSIAGVAPSPVPLGDPPDFPADANPTCPVMEGEAVDPEVYTEYQGKRVYLCCKKCLKAFTLDPAKFVAKLPQFQAASEPVPTAFPDVTLGDDAFAARVAQRLFATNDPQMMAVRRAFRMAAVQAPAAPPAIHSPAFVQNDIDRFIVQSWTDAGLPQADVPPALCDDATFARRVYLDVIGVVPTLAELNGFLAEASPGKRERLVDALLARDQDYADHWTPFWEDALGSTNVNNQGGVPTRGNYRAWINASFRDNKPFDVFAAELIDTTMPGAQKPSFADANGRRTRTSYILNETHTATLQSAAAVGQVFLGTAMKCASCHNHFENAEWPQTRFLAFAGMFGDHDLEAIRCEVKSGRTVAAEFPFEVPGAPATVPTTEEGRLRRAAQLVTDPANPRFSRAIVNRLWKRSFGLGLVEPADDFREDTAPSHPELLDWLAYDLMAHDFDLKRTMRLILTSRTYQLEHQPSLEDVYAGVGDESPRYFRSPPLRRLTAEQLIDSVRRVLAQSIRSDDRLFRRSLSTALTQALGRPASRNEISTSRADAAAVVQLLELLNGEEFAALVYGGELARDPARGVPDLYRAVLSRPPTSEELAEANRFLATGASTEPGPAQTTTLLDDKTPAGASLSGVWEWADDIPAHTGATSHRQVSHGKPVQHYALGGFDAVVGEGATFGVWVYLDPANPPVEIMLQVHSGSWEHRAFWGEDFIGFGQSGSTSRLRAGDLPEPGRWVRLEVHASAIGVGRGTRAEGFSFDQVGGRVWWDTLTLTQQSPSPAAMARGDLLWALLVSPEFQYVR